MKIVKNRTKSLLVFTEAKLRIERLGTAWLSPQQEQDPAVQSAIRRGLVQVTRSVGKPVSAKVQPRPVSAEKEQPKAQPPVKKEEVVVEVEVELVVEEPEQVEQEAPLVGDKNGDGVLSLTEFKALTKAQQQNHLLEVEVDFEESASKKDLEQLYSEYLELVQ